MNNQQKPIILLVEDDQISGEMYQSALNIKGLNCLWVKTAEEGLQKVKEVKPSLILLDIKLENGMDGFVMLEKLKKDPELKDIPVFLITNIWETGNREKGLALGAEKFIAKTEVLPGELVKIVKERLRI